MGWADGGYRAGGVCKRGDGAFAVQRDFDGSRSGGLIAAADAEGALMYGLSSRGLADILNPTAGTSLNCGLFAGGVFNKACWCASFPSLCSSADYVATKALEDPSVYNTLMQPPVVGAPTGAALTLPPASGADAAATENALLSQQILDWQAQDRASLAQTQANLDQLAQSQPPFCPFSTPVQAADGSWSCGGGSTNWLLYGAIAVAAVLTLSSLNFSGAPRGYRR
jgi:hypothetical protein